MSEIEQQQLLYTQILSNLLQSNMSELLERMNKVESKLKELITTIQSMKD